MIAFICRQRARAKAPCRRVDLTRSCVAQRPADLPIEWPPKFDLAINPNSQGPRHYGSAVATSTRRRGHSVMARCALIAGFTLLAAVAD